MRFTSKDGFILRHNTMKTTAISVRYASLKAVKRFFATKETAFQFPSDFDLSNADEKLFVNAVRSLANAEPNSKGERIVKPIFSFGRVLIKMSKNADNFAIAQCTVYITEYDYNDEKRVQIVIAPPMDNEFEDSDDLDFLGAKPVSKDDTGDDEDDEDEDDADSDEDEDEEPKSKSKSKSKK